MFKWLVRMWQKFRDWQHPHPIAVARDNYYPSNLHGRRH